MRMSKLKYEKQKVCSLHVPVFYELYKYLYMYYVL